MGIKVYYQGILVANTGNTTEEFPRSGSKSDVLKAIITRHPSIKHLNFVVAVNGVISHGEQQLKEGDSLTLIPPAPGG
jgi:molybdopterin converting factor small subunit